MKGTVQRMLAKAKKPKDGLQVKRFILNRVK